MAIRPKVAHRTSFRSKLLYDIILCGAILAFAVLVHYDTGPEPEPCYLWPTVRFGMRLLDLPFHVSNAVIDWFTETVFVHDVCLNTTLFNPLARMAFTGLYKRPAIGQFLEKTRIPPLLWLNQMPTFRLHWQSMKRINETMTPELHKHYTSCHANMWLIGDGMDAMILAVIGMLATQGIKYLMGLIGASVRDYYYDVEDGDAADRKVR